MKTFVLCTTFLLIAATTSARAAQSSVDTDLRHEAMCSKWARTFQERPEWQGSNATFTSHFNKNLEKCLVEVTSSSIVSGEVMESHHVYDALENKMIGGEIVMKKLPKKDGQEKVLSIVMVRNGKILGKKQLQAAREAYAWYQTLMSD